MLNDIKARYSSGKGKRVKQKLEHYRKLNDRLNFQIPNFVTFGKGNSKGSSLVMDDGIVRLNLLGEKRLSDLNVYIGRVEKSGKGRPYTEQFLVEMLNFLTSSSKKGEKIRILCGNFVGECLNDSEEDRYFSFSEQKEYLLELVDKVAKERLWDMEIIDLKTENEKLYAKIYKKRANEISSPNSQYSLGGKGKIDSSEIFDHLNRLALLNSDFSALLKSLKPSNANAGDHYGTAEISIRIADLIKNRNFQGGSRLQSKLDNLITFLINPKIPGYKIRNNENDSYYKSFEDFEELNIFRLLLSGMIGDKEFCWLYFDTDLSEKFYELKDEKNKFIEGKMLTYRNLAMGILIGVGVTLVPGACIYKKNKLEHEKKVNASIEKALIHKTIGTSVEGGRLSTVTEKTEQRTIVQDVVKWGVEMFKVKYDISDSSQLEIIKNLLLNEAVIDLYVTNLVIYVGSGSNRNTMEFIDRVVEKNQTFLIANGINTIPYKNIKKLEPKLKNTIFYEGKDRDKFVENLRISIKNMPSRGTIYFQFNPIFITTEGQQKTILEVRGDNNTQSGIESMLSSLDIKDKEIRNHIYSLDYDAPLDGLSDGQDIAYDYFWQTIPEVRKIFNQIEITFFGGYFQFHDDYIVKSKFIKSTIIKEYLKNEEKLKYLANDDIRLSKYLVSEFAKKYEAKYISAGLKLEAYKDFKSHKEAIKNTFNYNGDVVIFAPFSKITPIGYVLNNKGVKYAVGTIRHNGKTYMCARVNYNEESDYRLDNHKVREVAERIMELLK